MNFLRRNLGAIICSISFIAALVLAFSTSCSLRILGIIASLGTLVSAIYLWMDPIWSKPWEREYQSSDWWSDSRPNRDMPQILIPGKLHGKGTKPRVEYQQLDTIYGIGDLKHNYIGVNKDDVLITRPNSSIPPFGPVIIRIRK